MTPADEYEALMLAVVVAARKLIRSTTTDEQTTAREQLSDAVYKLDGA